MDNFENLRRIHEMINSMIRPYQEIHKYINLINRSMLPITKDILSIQESIVRNFEPLIRTHELFRIDVANEALKLSKAAQLYLDQLQLVLSRFDQAAHLKIEVPESLYPRLRELALSINDVLPKEHHDDLHSSITVTEFDELGSKSTLNWENLKTYLSWFWSILAILISLSTHLESSVQSERHHQELMIEERKQTELLMEIRDINREALEHSKELAESILKDIEILIPENQLDPEDEDNADEPVD